MRWPAGARTRAHGLLLLYADSMETVNEITIRAPAATVFALAADTEDWPRILPHYDDVRRLKGSADRKIVRMAARRALPLIDYPVRWTAEQHNYADEGRITFTHRRGISRGMAVEWQLTERDGHTHVRIWHEFHSRLPLIGGFFARRIVGELFVSYIAGKTLARIKQIAEGTGR